MRRWILLFLMFVALVAAGCARKGARPALPPLDSGAITDPGLQGARYALDRYLAARQALDYERVYEVLTPRTRQAYTLDEMRQFFKDYQGYSVGQVGRAEELQDRWVRFPVMNVQWVIRGRPAVSGDLWYITLHFEGDRWGVALADPLVERAGAAAAAGNPEALHQVADLMLSVDPYSFRAHVQKGYAHLYTGNASASLAELRRASAVVPPPAAGEVLQALGDLFRIADQPRQAADFYRQAIESMNKYEGLYDNGLTASLHRAMAIASLEAGDVEAARRSAVAAQLQSPFDGRNHALAGALVAR